MKSSNLFFLKLRFKYILFFSALIFGFAASAESLFNKKIPTGEYLFDVLVSQGIEQDAVKLTFQMFDYNVGRIPNTNYAVIVDYSLPSTSKRLFLMNFNTGIIEKFYVSHGINSGVLRGRRFSNLQNSLKSSLGFFYAKGTYQSGKNGLSLYLDGIDRSNNNARNRSIVFHGAHYVSDQFIADNGRLGWSEGCFSVTLQSAGYLIRTLQMGSIIFSYHRDLMIIAHQYPDEQQLGGREIIPPGVNPYKTSLEGGDDFNPEFLSPNPHPDLISPLDFLADPQGDSLYQ